jgi:hypothetical protein
MPPDKERRPPGQEKAADQDAHGGGIMATIATAADMRRRREAAHRLPPLASGDHDPIDMLAMLPIPGRPQPCRGMFGDGGKWQPCCGRVTA